MSILTSATMLGSSRSLLVFILFNKCWVTTLFCSKRQELGQGSGCFSCQQGWHTSMSQTLTCRHAQTGAPSPPATYHCCHTPLPSAHRFPFLRGQLPNRSNIMDSFLQNAAHTSPWKPPRSSGQSDVAPNSRL